MLQRFAVDYSWESSLSAKLGWNAPTVRFRWMERKTGMLSTPLGFSTQNQLEYIRRRTGAILFSQIIMVMRRLKSPTEVVDNDVWTRGGQWIEALDNPPNLLYGRVVQMSIQDKWSNRYVLLLIKAQRCFFHMCELLTCQLAIKADLEDRTWINGFPTNSVVSIQKLVCRSEIWSHCSEWIWECNGSG